MVLDNDLDNRVFANEIIEIASSVLTEKQLDIVLSYSMTSITYKELGNIYGVSSNRIMQIYVKSLRIIRGRMDKISPVYKGKKLLCS